MPNSSLPRRPVIDLREILEYSDGIFSVVGLLLNVLLLYLITQKTGSRFKDYKKLLLQNCIIDTIYNVVYFITRAQVECKDGIFFLLVTNAYARYPRPYNAILGCLFLFTAYFCVTQLPVQFIYRYLLIVRNINISTRQYLSMLFIPLFFPFIFFICSIFIFWPYTNDYLEKGKLLEADVFYYKEIPNYMTADMRDWPLMAIVMYATAMVTVSYSIVIWTSYKVWKHLDAMEAHMTLNTKDVNRQMTITLIIQAILPLFVLLLPIAITALMLFTRASISGIGISISLLLSWIPIVNSLTTIIVVKSYRNTMINFIFYFSKIRRNNAVNVTSNIVKDTSIRSQAAGIVLPP